MSARNLCTLTIFGMLLLPSVYAEPASSSTTVNNVEQLTVTAGFRDNNLMDFAGSASVINDIELKERAARHIEDIISAVPNVSFSAAGSRARFLQIRGIGDLEQFVDPKHFPSVGIVLDGIELSNVATGALLLDSEQVEVLRGPQGTRFGASALAGMVNILGKNPGDKFEAELTGGYGNFDTWNISGSAGGPITDNLKVRASIRQFSSDGYTDNAFLGRDDTQEKDELAARVKLLWDVTDRIDASLTALYFDSENGYDAFSLDNVRTTITDQPGSDDQQIAAVALGFDVDLGQVGDVEIKATYTDSEELYAFDEDWVFSGFCNGVRCAPSDEFFSTDAVERNRDQATVDLRWLNEFDRLSVVTGAYIHHRREDLSRQRFGFFGSDYVTNRYALYGQLEYEFNDRFTARVGIRGEAFDDDYKDSTGIDTQSNDSYWSGDATLEYRVTPETLLYVTAARGAKPGGVNTSATSFAPFISTRFQPFVAERQRFDTETLFNKEVGLKGRYLDDRLALRLAAFHTDRSDAQLEASLYDAATFIFVASLDNVSEAENYGIELELDWALNSKLDFIARAGWLGTDVDSMPVFDLDLNDFRTLRGRDQTKAPDWQYHFGLRWRPIEPLTAQVAVEGQTENFFGYYHDEKLDGYTVMNASVGYQYRSANIRAWVRNLLDEDYAVHGFYFANDPRDAFTVNRNYQQLGEPRVYGVEVSWAF